MSPCSGDLVGVPFRSAPVEGFASVDEVVHGAYGFFDGRVSIRAVAVEKIDVVELEPGEGGVGAFDEVLAREAAVVDRIGAEGAAPVYLGGDDEVVAFPAGEQWGSVFIYGNCTVVEFVCLQPTTPWLHRYP